MSDTTDRRAVTLALEVMLETVIAAAVDRGTAPGPVIGHAEAPKPKAGEPTPRSPYALVVELPGGSWEEGLGGAPIPGWEYQVTSVGTTATMAAWMADHVRSALLDLASGGGYSHAITTVAHAPAGVVHVCGRELSSAGAAAREGKLWNVHEVYRLYVSA